MEKKAFDKVSYNNSYNAKAYDRIGLMLPKGYKDRVSEYAKANGESVNGYIKRLIDEDIGLCDEILTDIVEKEGVLLL